MSKFNWSMKAGGIILLMTGMAVPLLAQKTFKSLHSFHKTDGRYPSGELVQATNGNLYGTTYQGGANVCTNGKVEFGCGTVFAITPSGTLTTIYSFCSHSNCADGYEPVTGLIQATNGNLYGTTQNGGASGGGTVFSMTPSGTLTTLYYFCSQSMAKSETRRRS
jgi:uncharacterized repeat protein (TIGR03803 family)